MDVVHFNRGTRRKAPPPPPISFEDVALREDDAAYTLDAEFESLGERHGDFLLVPGVICRSRPDGMDLVRMPRYSDAP